MYCSINSTYCVSEMLNPSVVLYNSSNGICIAYLSTFENFPGVESARQLVSDILPIARGRYK